VIVVCGEALIDRIGPRDVAGGGPLNTARGLARLGVPVAFLGHLSSDAYGRDLAGLLEADGVSLKYATVGPEPTTMALANLDSEGRATYHFVVEGTSAPKLTLDMIPAEFGAEINAVFVGSLGLVLEPMADALVELADRQHGKRLLMLDPNIRLGLGPEASYRRRLHHVIGTSTVVKASDADLAWLYPDCDYQKAAERILDRGVALVVVTLGAEGAFGAHRDIRVHVAAPHVGVVDTVGAGDAFGAALLAWLHDNDRIRPDLALDEAEVKAALEYACLAAAITCARTGADPPRKSELVPA
jgi:fructokinase